LPVAGLDVVKGVSPEQQFIKVMYDELVAIMGSEQAALAEPKKPPLVILLGASGGAAAYGRALLRPITETIWSFAR
jgi:signal recognition particle GTPase